MYKTFAIATEPDGEGWVTTDKISLDIVYNLVDLMGASITTKLKETGLLKEDQLYTVDFTGFPNSVVISKVDGPAILELAL